MATIRSSMIFSVGEKFISLVIVTITTMILARLLTPTETGIYSVSAGIINIAQMLRDFGISNYIVQETELTRSRLSTALGIALCLGLGLAAILAALARPLADFYGEPRLFVITLVMCLNFIIVAFASVGQAQLRRDMNFAATLRVGVVGTLAHSTASVLLASHGYGALGMAWASVISAFTNLISIYYYLSGKAVLLPRLKEWRRIMHFGVFASSAYLLQELGQRAPDIIIGRLQGFAQAGYYSRGNGLITLFQQALLNAILPVAISSLAQASREKGDLVAPYRKFMLYTTGIAWPFLAMMAVLAYPMIKLAYGDQWLVATAVAQILCVAAMFATVGRICMSLFSATGAVRRLLFLQSVAVPVQVAALLAGAFVNIEAAAWGVLFSSAVLAVLSLHYANRLLGISWLPVAADLGRSALTTGAATAIPLVVLFLRGIGPNDFWGPTAMVAFGGLAGWLAAMLATRHPLVDEFLNLIRNRKNKAYVGSK